MKTCLARKLFAPILLCLGACATHAAVVFTNGSAWKYVLGTAEASSPTDAWRGIGFNDGSWPGGNTPIGYGEPEIVTALPTSSAGGYNTVFLRKALSIVDVGSVSQFELSMQVDDGVVVWLNGTEIGRTNAPAGAPAFNATATAAPTQFFPYTITLNSGTTPSLGSVLQNGNNVLAVHLLNGSSGSSDLFFEAMLSTTQPDFAPPTVSSVNPNGGSTVNSLTQVTVTFSEQISGLEAGDLLINGTGAASFSAAGNAFTFSFPQPAYGNVAITWATGHGITDVAVPPNPFNATAPGHTWSYSLIDNIPPTIASVVPQAAASVPTLTEIQVSFSEAVSGIHAADLLVNNSPATNATALSGSLYVFGFPPPAPGSVAVTWAGGHGITDLAAPPNPFAGGSWSYILDPNATTADLLITEFMASNTRTLADEDGDYEDWIEIHNPGATPVDLLGWSLTDSTNDLRQWEFPATNIAAGGYMIVFASDKRRSIPGAPLHTNFKLSGGGEYLALVRDGTNVTSEFSPAFPQQFADVSYGLHQNAAVSTLVNIDATARVLVPANDLLALTWTQPGFSDGSWIPAANGAGFEAMPGEPGETPYGSLIATDLRTAMHNVNASAFIRLPFQVANPAAVSGLTLQARYDDGFVGYINGRQVTSRNAPISSTVANSETEFSGTQGQDNWFYGYYNQSTDGTPGYQTNDFVLFPRDGGPHSATSYWNGSIWDWFAGNPPWTELSAQGGHPNGNNNGNVHWAIRRWRSEVNGTVRVTLRYAKANASCGNGTTGRIFHNGAQVWSQTVLFSDSAGINTMVTVNNVQTGDVFDFAIDPLGTDATQADGCDGTTFTVSIEFVAPDLAFNSAASGTRSNSLGREFEAIPLDSAAQWLVPGENILAIHGLNAHATNADFLIQSTLEGVVPLPLTQASPRFFPVPTPGAANGTGVQNLGPIVSEASHSPAEPLDSQGLTVTARITPAVAPVLTNVLTYRVMFGSEVSLPLLDDGAHGDGAAGDGVYGAVIPASAATVNQMIRWYITSTDTGGRLTRWPVYSDPLKTPQYLGTIVANPTLTNPLPVLHWFIQSTTGADSDTGSRASIYFLGRFYDNVYMNLHGQSSRGFPKKSYDVEFNPGYKFTYREGEPAVSDVNWLTTYPDKAHMRNKLSHEAFAAFGNAHHWVEPVRVQQNGAFYGTAHLVENGDDEFVERLGLNPENPLYKVYNTFNTSPTHATLGTQNVEKKTRKYEGSADLQALLNGVLLTGEPRRVFLYDNIDIPQMMNSMAIRAIIGEQDCCHKNYYFYRDTLGDREWEIWPWDVDLSYGRRWIGASTYWDDNMIIDTTNPVGNNNGALTALYNTPEIREMYWRRFRTLMDEFLQAPGTPTNQLIIERRVDALAALMAPDGALDLAQRGTWCCASAGPFTQATIPQPTNYQNVYQAADRLKFGYLPYRRGYLFTNRSGVNLEIPNAQPADARVLIASFEANPASGNQAEEYVVLTNLNNYAVDISGWRLEGAIEHTFHPGTVIPAGRLIYVTPDANAFRARTTGPRGGQALLVQGGYKGQLSARGETLRLLTRTRRLVDYWNYPAAPSAAQNALRVTEINYHPAPLAGNTNSPDEFEFIELKNTGLTTLSLAGVRFTNGIAFNFTGSAVTSLATGASVVVVKNPAQFALRYPTVPPASIAGAYTGSLDNSGERLTLLDAAGEEILDFVYNNAWYPITDGLGFSLVVVNEQAAPDEWSKKSQWRPGGALQGSPSQDETAAPSIAPVLITEVLSRSETPPPTDSIELHNPTGTNVNIGGWLLTDDFRTPNKFRIPDVIIPAGGYVVFNEGHFNPGGLGFALGSDGDEVWLFSADAGTNLTGYVHGHNFGGADNNLSFGRVVTSDGREHFAAQNALTLGSANSSPRIGPVVISEIHYRPADLYNDNGAAFTGPTYSDNNRDEFIEIANISSTNVALFDPSAPGNTWKITGGVDFTFPEGITLVPNERMLIVNFSTNDAAALAAFRARFSVNPIVRIFGPYGGSLNNSSDEVELKRPVLLAGVTLVYVLVDEVEYRDTAPWPAGADGYGYSLQRWSNTVFGNEPTNWVAAPAKAGAATVTNSSPPRFVTQPASQTVSAGAAATFAPLLAGSSPQAYQWLFNGIAIAGATNASLTLPIAGLEHSGDYTLLANNSVGLAVSATAALTVVVPPAILAPPTNALVRVPPDPAAAPTTNATFSVSAFSRSALSYQWRSNGVPVSGATASSLTITNVRTNDLACFTVVVSDGVTAVESPTACLYPLVAIPNPLPQGPLPQTVPVGSLVTLSAQYGGWPPPFTNEWRIGSQGQITNVENQMVAFHTFTATNVVATQQWRFVVKNLATPGGRGSALVPIVTVADSDGDGLPDPWESTYGAASGGNLDRNADTDGDGMLNWQEYEAGTDPTNPSSYLKIDSITATNGVRIEFGAVSNKTYQLLRSGTIAGGVWTSVSDLPARSTNRTEVILDAAGPTNGFYRVRTPRQP